MRPVGRVSSPTSDGRSEMLTALLQPASEPAPREGETTYGGGTPRRVLSGTYSRDYRRDASRAVSRQTSAATVHSQTERCDPCALNTPDKRKDEERRFVFRNADN